MITETAIPMMVLAVNIRRDGATDGDVFGSWDNGRKKPPGQEDRDQVGEQQARLRGDKSCPRIKGADAVERSHLDSLTGTDPSVPVGTSVPACYSTLYAGDRDTGRLRRTRRREDSDAHRPSPAAERAS